MTWIVDHIKGLMLLAGALTSTMLLAAIAPHLALQATFGDTVQGPLAELVVRSWGALVALVGAMLVYGAYHPAQRPLVLVVAGQIITAVLADHYGVMGLGGKPLSLARVAGVVLILCGVLLVQGTWATASPAHPTAAVKAQEN